MKSLRLRVKDVDLDRLEIHAADWAEDLAPVWLPLNGMG